MYEGKLGILGDVDLKKEKNLIAAALIRDFLYLPREAWGPDRCTLYRVKRS